MKTKHEVKKEAIVANGVRPINKGKCMW